MTRDGQPWGSYCQTDIDGDVGGGAPAPVVTVGMVERAFRSYAWPASPLLVQPPNGRTLVNFKTNFRTENTAPTTKKITLLGQPITIEANPSAYTWRHGDGTSTTTTSPGAKYPDLDVTYEYRHPTTVQPSVQTTYTGRYRIGNHPWQQIPGTTTVPGTPVSLEVVEAQPTLIDY